MMILIGYILHRWMKAGGDTAANMAVSCIMSYIFLFFTQFLPLI